MSSPLRVGFLGPVGTFSHDAVRTLGLAVDAVALPTIGDVFEALSTGEIDRAVVPIENALEGTVSATLDALIFDHDVLIQGEVVVPIRLHLMARPGVERAAITEVLSYTHALAQCRHFLAELAVATVAVASTADAARLVAAGESTQAAIASEMAASVYGLHIVDHDVEDATDNATRFIVVGRGEVTAPTGRDRTSIVCFQDADRPGSLHGILGRFAARDLNLTKIESRPTKRGLGDYCFVIDVDGHVCDDIIAECLADLQAHLTRVKFLGSYPVAGAAASTRRDEVSMARAGANEWVRGLQGLVKSE